MNRLVAASCGTHVTAHSFTEPGPWTGWSLKRREHFVKRTESSGSLLDGECSHCAFSGTEALWFVWNKVAQLLHEKLMQNLADAYETLWNLIHVTFLQCPGPCQPRHYCPPFRWGERVLGQTNDQQTLEEDVPTNLVPCPWAIFSCINAWKYGSMKLFE